MLQHHFYKCCSPLKQIEFSDMAGDIHPRQSTSVMLFLLRSSLVSQQSLKHSVVALHLRNRVYCCSNDNLPAVSASFWAQEARACWTGTNGGEQARHLHEPLTKNPVLHGSSTSTHVTTLSMIAPMDDKLSSSSSTRGSSSRRSSPCHLDSFDSRSFRLESAWSISYQGVAAWVGKELLDNLLLHLPCIITS